MTRDQRGKQYTTKELEDNFDMLSKVKWIFFSMFVITWIAIYILFVVK